MEKTTTYEFTKEDIALLKQEIPESPCDGCSLQRDGSCCGCPEERKYVLAVQPYKDAKIFEYAVALKSIRLIQRRIVELSSKRTEIVAYLPDALSDLV